MTAPETFGSYLVYDQLGVGGMATVHLAESRGVRKRVALKRLLPHAAEDPDLLASFVKEAKLAAYLHHPNIARTFDFGKVGDTYFMAMELVPGPTFGQLVRQCKSTVGRVPLPISLHLLAQVCEALEYAHNLCDEHGKPLGLIHRDISPGNIVIANTGLVKLIDFGLAKAATGAQTQAGMVKGKFSYIAPEYLDGKLDKRVDVWSLGVVAHELLTMRRLFHSTADLEVVRRVKEMAIPPPSAKNPEVPPELDAVVMTALQRDPDRRWQSAAAMRTALLGAITELGIEVTNRRALEWIEWAFTQEAKPPERPTQPLDEAEIIIEEDDETEASGISQLIASLDPPSRHSSVRKRPKLPTPVSGMAQIRRRKVRARTWWLLGVLVLIGAAAVGWQHRVWELLGWQLG